MSVYVTNQKGTSLLFAVVSNEFKLRVRLCKEEDSFEKDLSGSTLSPSLELLYVYMFTAGLDPIYGARFDPELHCKCKKMDIAKVVKAQQWDRKLHYSAQLSEYGPSDNNRKIDIIYPCEGVEHPCMTEDYCTNYDVMRSKQLHSVMDT
eukprot:Seg1783.7 transcript_id=Seg1783.7/GoldUCD/mRNA.D3Y31 product="hypothetical protein" protein_id=Seg1783.7/GoldUCD/D3Y31